MLIILFYFFRLLIQKILVNVEFWFLALRVRESPVWLSNSRLILMSKCWPMSIQSIGTMLITEPNIKMKIVPITVRNVQMILESNRSCILTLSKPIHSTHVIHDLRSPFISLMLILLSMEWIAGKLLYESKFSKKLLIFFSFTFDFESLISNLFFSRFLSNQRIVWKGKENDLWDLQMGRCR